MRAFIFIAIAFLPGLGFTQNTGVCEPTSTALVRTNNYLNLFIKTDLYSRYSGQEINDFIIKLEEKKLSSKNDKEFLHYLFYKTHRKLLKQYTEYCPFDALIKDGTYNCLTGTALYAVLLNHFNFEFEVIKLN